MKKIRLFFAAPALLMAVAACHPGQHTVMISSDDNHNTIKVEYSGNIIFTADGISSMPQYSYLTYSHNGEKLEAQRDLDAINYEVNGSAKSTVLNDEGKALLAEAVHKIRKTQKR